MQYLGAFLLEVTTRMTRAEDVFVALNARKLTLE